MHPAQYTTRSRDPAATVAVTAVPDATLACGCAIGAHADTSLRFYVTCCREIGGRHLILLGPFPDHCAALAAVDDAQRYAEKADAWATFYHFGTCSADLSAGLDARVVFNADGTMRAKGGAA